VKANTIVRVRDVMHQDYVRADGLLTVADGLALLRGHHARVLIIRKRDDDDEYGMVLLADIARNVLAPNRAPERVNLYEIMTKPVIGVRPGMNVRYCARLFERFGLSLAPVIDAAEEVVGMVGYSDLVMGGFSSSAASVQP
jgi:CBS-domain-containing membrane protein